MTDGVDRFFAYARERHAIYLRRRSGVSGPWTTDPILRQYSFTNVFRELDKTTVWFRENVREKIKDPAELLLATVVFRWFNRIETGRRIFVDKNWLGGDTAWFMMKTEYHMVNGVHQELGCTCLDPLRAAITAGENAVPNTGPYVTGAYIIKTPDGYSKLDGVLKCIEWFMEQEHTIGRLGDRHGAEPNDHGYQEVARICTDYAGEMTLETVWDWLRQFPFLGDFMAYEIVTDLRWTPLLDRAPDIMTWANPGPGAARGLGRVNHDDKDMYDQRRHKAELVEMMESLLWRSQDPQYWPQQMDGGSWWKTGFQLPEDAHLWQTRDAWPAWEMRDVEHTLCEFDKYERARLGEGRPRGRFKG